MTSFHSKIWILRLAALLAPAFTVFYSRLYEHPDPGERKILRGCLLLGFCLYATAAALLYILNKIQLL